MAIKLVFNQTFGAKILQATPDFDFSPVHLPSTIFAHPAGKKGETLVKPGTKDVYRHDGSSPNAAGLGSSASHQQSLTS